MVSAPRGRLIRFLAAAINEVTVEARGGYEPLAPARLVRCNEAIHRLSGHLRDLADPQEPMTASRADGVLEQLAVLAPATFEGLLILSLL